ncbi:alpha/beta hydrolase [Streptococcus sobrinus]|uniref:BD-FAE-like domain-containing protein n=8 Tax=Streptococcus sobrinus TaxID=1310 RepID=U2KM47_9STRE|nr:alpha/beta hydrolase [Streptococcus sobrinus]RKW12180.1 MAG: alpha/beta hydrolase [Catonella sp.]AWN20089.1 alpha/beta hydrolase [Streptococcus sobrinus]AWN60942.1 alpha/beta hydrolase [Streptococcus sobrinus]AWN62815.1 alpha/beta hydrolase [Streptococcus sobrinus]EMP69621.1 esterase [Streptococcus sobrinus DSM 20742 = ATCC 33478]
MKINTDQLWSEADKKAVTYTTYLVEETSDIKNYNPRPAVIICGGGGFFKVTDREKEPVALYFLNKGFQAITLDYRVGQESGYPAPLYDLAKMLLVTREKAEQWNVDPDKIIFIGFSAGATHCASLANRWNEPSLQAYFAYPEEKIRPSLVVLSYPLLDFSYQYDSVMADPNNQQPTNLSPMPKLDFLTGALKTVVGKELTKENLKKHSPIEHISRDTVPTFIWGMQNDDCIYNNALLDYAKKLKDNGVFYELHMFAVGEHGLSVINRNTQAEFSDYETLGIWKRLCMNFINQVLGLN